MYKFYEMIFFSIKNAIRVALQLLLITHSNWRENSVHWKHMHLHKLYILVSQEVLSRLGSVDSVRRGTILYMDIYGYIKKQMMVFINNT